MPQGCADRVDTTIPAGSASGYESGKVALTFEQGRNRMAPGTEGGVTHHFPGGEQTTIFDAAERYRSEGVPLVVLAGKEYGSGSSRDWAAKGPMLLGVRAATFQPSALAGAFVTR